MPRLKKSAGQPPPENLPPDSEAHEAAENEGMAHISSDALAGSPDVFARKRSEEPILEPAAEPEPTQVSTGEPGPVEAPPAAPVTVAPAPEPPIAAMEPAPPFVPA